MDKKEINKFLIITLSVACVFLMFLFLGALDIINDKNAYINGLQSDRAICNGKLDNIIGDYAKVENDLKEYKRKYGEIDG